MSNHNIEENYKNKEVETVVQETPVGMLIAKPWGEPDFPGIAIFLRYQDKEGKTQERMVSLTEYTSSESVCGYDPMHPDTIARETAEVPQQRRNGDTVTPGIITRTWEDISDEDADHKRTIHFAEDAKVHSKDWSKLVKMRNITFEEYDLLCRATNDNNKLMHWNNMYSIVDTVYDNEVPHRTIRGFNSALHTYTTSIVRSLACMGLRPTFEALDPASDCADLRVGDIVVMGTLYVGSEALKVPTNPESLNKDDTSDIFAYDKDGSGVTSKITLGTALEDAAYQVKAIYVGDGLFVCNRVMLNYISWEQIQTALSNSKPTKDWSKLVKMRNVTSDEYDLLRAATNESNALMHWKNAYSITDIVCDENVSSHVARGYLSAKNSGSFNAMSRISVSGWRPAFEALCPDTDCADLSVGDVVVMGTLYIEEEAVKVPANPVWDGDITAYDKPGSHIASKVTLGTVLEDVEYQVKAVYIGNGVFVCDRVVLNWISWNQIHAALSASEKSKDWSKLVKLRNITSEEYDLLCDAANENNDLMHWNKMYSITDTAYGENASYCKLRGSDSARDSYYDYVTYRSYVSGWRAAFESLTPDTDCTDLSVGDVVVMGTLYVGDNAIKVPTNPIWNGDITAYDEDGSGATSKITLGAALEDTAYQVKVVYVGNGLFVCDRVILNYISWKQIQAALS